MDNRGVKGTVVRPEWEPEELIIGDNRAEAQAGMELSRLVRAAAEAGRAGIEFAAGIQGMVGGGGGDERRVGRG